MNYLFLKIYATSEGAVSHNVLYDQQFSIACYQILYANYIVSVYQTCPVLITALADINMTGLQNDKITHVGFPL